MKKDNIELWLPLKNYVLTQGYYENANSWYKDHGMLGHGGYDFVTFYDDKVLACEDGYIYKIVNRYEKDFSKFRAVFQLVELEDNYVLELCYGHANKIFVSNDNIVCGREVISEGNRGIVFSGGKEVSVEAREEGSKEGTHLHFQARICKKVKEYDKNYPHLSSQEDETKPYQDKDGSFYMIDNYYNGYAGFVPVKWSSYAGDSIIYRKIIETLKTILSLIKK